MIGSMSTLNDLQSIHEISNSHAYLLLDSFTTTADDREYKNEENADCPENNVASHMRKMLEGSECGFSLRYYTSDLNLWFPRKLLKFLFYQLELLRRSPPPNQA